MNLPLIMLFGEKLVMRCMRLKSLIPSWLVCFRKEVGKTLNRKRNRAIILLMYYAMLRVGEVVVLRYCDVVDTDGEIKAETTLSAAQTKGNKGRKVWFSEKIRVELAAYVATHKSKQLTQPLFYTHCSEGFTANTLTHIVNGIYKGAGISGATSNSGRRTGLTNLAKRSVGVRVLMALAGESNKATTQRYIDLRTAMLKAAVELV
jgi:integrase/recombinase XerD